MWSRSVTNKKRTEKPENYWDDLIKKHWLPPQYSKFGRLVGRYWKLERKLVVERSLSYLHARCQDKKLVMLKTDLWNEAIDSSSGSLSDFLRTQETQISVVGMDISLAIVRRARKMCNQEYMLNQCDSKRLPYRDNTFDFILDLSTLDHMSPMHVGMVMNEYNRVLNKGGILTLVFDSVVSPRVQYMQKTFNRFRSSGIPEFEYHWRFTPNWIEAELQKRGFVILAESPLGIMSASVLFLKAMQLCWSNRWLPEFFCHSINNIKLAKKLKHVLPLSSQYLFITEK